MPVATSIIKRRNGMATFRKRGNNWQVGICIEGNRESATFDTKAQAQAWADKRSVELRQAQQLATTEDLAQKTLRELLQEVLDELMPLSRTRRTRQAAEYRIKRMQRHRICDLMVRRLTIEDFTRYVQERRREGIAAATIRRELGVVRAAINRLIVRGLLVFNPVQPVLKSLMRDRIVTNLLSATQIQQMEAAYEELNNKRTKNPWLFWAFRLAAATGLRKAELLGLRWEDIDLELRVATIERVDDIPDDNGERSTEGTKNGEAVREVALSPEAVDILQKLPRAIDPAFRGCVLPMSYEAVSSAFERMKKRAGLPKFRWHDLRHMAATNLLDKLKNVAHVAAVTGHKDWKSLSRYTHPKAADVARMLAD
jgi:integrase